MASCVLAGVAHNLYLRDGKLCRRRGSNGGSTQPIYAMASCGLTDLDRILFFFSLHLTVLESYLNAFGM
jgi:hypothetical protein